MPTYHFRFPTLNTLIPQMERYQTRGTGSVDCHTRAVQIEKVGESIRHERHSVARQLVHSNVFCVSVHVDLIVSGRKVAHKA